MARTRPAAPNCPMSLPLRSALRRSAVVLGYLVACILIAPVAATASSRLLPDAIRVDIPHSLMFGSLPTNRGLSLSVQVHEHAADTDEQLVAVFESPAFVQQISPLVRDPERRVLSTTVALGPISASLGNPPKAAPVHIAIARQQGLHLEERGRRTLFVTVAVPGYADHGSRPSGVNLAGMSWDLADSSQLHENALDGTLLDGKTEETDLLGNGDQNRAHGYWKMVNGMLHRQLDLDLPSRQPNPVRRMPIVHFRLYTNGEAQLIEIERSSGDAEVDRAAILAVVNAHPFPPRPTASSDSHVDVHANMPIPSR